MFKLNKNFSFGGRLSLNPYLDLDLKTILGRLGLLTPSRSTASRRPPILTSAINSVACIRSDVRDQKLNRIPWRPSMWLLVSRNYAKKSKDGHKQGAKKGKTDKPHVELSEDEIGEVMDVGKMKRQMELTLEHLKKEYSEQLTLRTSVGILDKIEVETPEGTFPLIQLGQVIQKNPQLMMINLVATPQYISCVKLAILGSGMNVNPQQEGTTLYIPIPKVTREHREDLAKNAKVLCEKTKEKLRNIQNNFTRDLKKGKVEHSEDLIFNIQEMILITTKKYIDEAEALMTAKQLDLLGKQ